jgi:DNA (cytosine-5)-methyltransferase 1
LVADGIECDVTTGGFPCQDTSVAGKGVGLAGARSGLWSEYARIIREVRPRYAIIENVPGLFVSGFDTVLCDLASLGYDAEWHCIPASAVGAPHRRDRIWIIANSRSSELREQPGRCDGSSWSGALEPRVHGATESLAYTDSWRRESERIPQYTNIQRTSGDQSDRLGASGWSSGADLAYTDSSDRHGRRSAVQVGRRALEGETETTSNSARDQWRTEPNVGRVAHGIPARVDRLQALGNAIVPQIAEVLGRAILAREKKPPEGGLAVGNATREGR